MNSKYYKNLLISHSPDSMLILRCLDIVKRYLIREKLIIVGGMAIDFALRLKGRKLYDDDDVPDYDFVSPHNWSDAYEIAQWLVRTEVKASELDVINAMHPTTMRVRVASESVADATFIPQKIFDAIPRLNYKGLDFVHPYYQYMDQHRALCTGFENIGLGRPVISNRWKKDMQRYDMLWEQYPLRWNGDKPELKVEAEQVIPLDIIQNQCVTGFAALVYWIEWAKKKGFKTHYNLGKFSITSAGVVYSVPTDSHGITMYSNNIEDLYKAIKSKYKPKNERFYTRFVDKFPRKVIIDNSWEILDNKHNWIAASKITNDIYMANMQTIMLYFITNYVLLNKLKKENRGYTFFVGYMVARDLVNFGAINHLDELLPTIGYYGTTIVSESFELAKTKLMKRYDESIVIPRQPHRIYERDLRTKTIPSAYHHFNPKDSSLFDMGGDQCDAFF